MTVVKVEIEQTNEEKDVVDTIVAHYNTSKAWRQAQEDVWDGYYKHYRFYRASSEHTMRANVYVPYIFAIVESVVPKMLNTIFNSSPIVSVMAREGGDEDLAFLLERFLDYAFSEEELDLYGTMDDFFKEAAIYGTSFMKVVPRFVGEANPTLSFIDADPIDIYKVFPDPRARSLKKAKWIIHRDWVDYDKLVSMAKQGFYKSSTVKELESWLATQGDIDEHKKERFTSIERDSEPAYDPERKTVEVLEYWDRKEIISVAGRQVVLKRESNPFGGLLPFVMTRYTSVPHEFYGIGIPEMAETLQEELNDLRNQRMDNVNIIINRMFIANKYADIDFDKLVSYPGNVILADSTDAVKPLDTRDVTRSIYMEEERLIADIQNVTGEWEYGRGQTPERRETATGIIRLQQAANIRFDAIVKRIEFGTIRTLAKTFIWYAYHFLSPERMATIVGEEDYRSKNGDRFFQMDPEDLLRQYHFQPMGSSTSAVKELRAQQVMNLYQAFNQDPMVDQYELRRMLMQAMDVKNVTKLLLTEEQAAAKMQAMQPPPPQVGPGQGQPLPEEMGGAPGAAGMPQLPPEVLAQLTGEAVQPGAVPQEMVGA